MADLPIIAQAGEALYGPHWMRELARALDVNERTVRRWASGEVEPRPSVYRDVHTLLHHRASQITALLMGPLEAKAREES